MLPEHRPNDVVAAATSCQHTTLESVGQLRSLSLSPSLFSLPFLGSLFCSRMRVLPLAEGEGLLVDNGGYDTEVAMGKVSHNEELVLQRQLRAAEERE